MDLRHLGISFNSLHRKDYYVTKRFYEASGTKETALLHVNGPVWQGVLRGSVQQSGFCSQCLEMLF